MPTILVILLALLAAIPAAALPAQAMESAAVTSSRAAATLVSDVDSVAPGGAVRLGLRLRLAPGWHTYWRNPGDAGVPAELAFALPAGTVADPVAWPVPTRQSEGPITTFAYTGEVLLAVPVRGASGPLAATLRASWLVCKDICVPEEGVFSLTLPPGDGGRSAQAELFAAAAARVPRPAAFQVVLDPNGVLHASGPELDAATIREAWFAPFDAGRVDASAPQAAVIEPGLVSLPLRLVGPERGAVPGILVLRDAGGLTSGYEVTATPGPVPGPVPTDGLATPVRWLGLALLGGLLLNVMPCVFPVLAMKAAGLLGLGAAARARARLLAISYLLGTVATFSALGFAVMAARAAGEGWGFQFQNPGFVSATAFVLFLVGLNLSGAFTLGGSLAGAGQALAGRGGHVGSFLAGALAVLVASPCTTPFMGAALAAALARSGWLAVGIFVSLGIGLALPYVVLAWVPGMGRALPRPGAWMQRARQVLAFPMYLTVAWLAWVLAQQAGADGVLFLAVGCTLLGFAAWLHTAGGRVAGLAVGVAVFAALTAMPVSGPAPAASDTAFSLPRLEALRAQGQPVFVDMGAAWCLTCLVNERVALAPEAVRTAFAAAGVTLLRGDWTRQDAEITRFLRTHGSDGVPLYVFYPAGGRPPVVLPQILTPGIVLGALAAA